MLSVMELVDWSLIVIGSWPQVGWSGASWEGLLCRPKSVEVCAGFEATWQELPC